MKTARTRLATRPKTAGRRAPRPEPREGDSETPDQSLKRHWKRYRKQLKKAQEHFSEDAVHQSRIEARRLLAVLELLGPCMRTATARKLARALKGHLDVSDGLRDTQVQLLILEPLQRKEPGLRRFRAHLRKREQRLKKQTRKSIRTLKTGRVGKWVASCRDELRRASRRRRDNSIPRKLLSPVRQAFGRTRKVYHRIVRDDPATIHRTRVSFKKFRYMVEALAKLEPGIGPEFIDELRRYQGLMGDIQDREVLLESFNRWILKKAPELKGVSAIRGEFVSQREERVRIYLEEARKLLDFWPLPDARRSAKSRRRSRLAGKGLELGASNRRERRERRTI